MAQSADELASAIAKLEVKYDTNWNNLPFELKEMIVKEMGLDTRTCLKMCSKSDKYLVESIPYKTEFFQACWHDKSTGEGLSELGCSEFCESIMQNRYHHCFILDETDFYQYLNKVTVVKNPLHGPTKTRIFELGSEEEAVKMIERFFYSILFAKNHRHECLVMEWVLKNTDGRVAHTDAIVIGNKKKEEIMDWLKVLPPKMERIFVQSKLKLIGIGGMENLWTSFNATYHNSDINNQQLLNFQTKQLKLGRANVTAAGVNKLFKKWIGKDYPKSSHFTVLLRGSPTFSQLVDGIECKIERNSSGSYTKIAMKTKPNNFLICLVPRGNFWFVDGSIENR